MDIALADGVEIEPLHMRLMIQHVIERPVLDSAISEHNAQLAAPRTAIPLTVETLKAAQKWSLFDKDNHDALCAAVRALNRASIDRRSARVRRPDND